MLEIGILFLAGMLFLGTTIMLVVMIKEFLHMKTAAILMEAAFKEHREVVDGVQQFVQHGLNSAEEQYSSVMNDYSKILDSNNHLQERINKMEANQKKPLAPDVTFN